MSSRALPRLACVLLLALSPVLAGCSKSSSKSPTAPGPQAVTSLLSGVTVGTTSATAVSGSLPAGAGASPSVAASDSFVAGTNAVLTVTVPDSATALLVAASGRTGYFRAPITFTAQMARASRAEKYARVLRAVPLRAYRAAADSTLLTVTVGILAGQSNAPLLFEIETAHSHSTTTAHTFYSTSRALGSGQLQFSLNWNRPVDLDLHVACPVGTDSVDIYYGNRGWPDDSTVGGTLDLDSNAGCDIDNVDNENITWGGNIPAHGTYRVRVDYWANCTVSDAVPYVVTIRQCGQVVRTIDGVAYPADVDAGSEFSGKVVATLTFSGCGTPAAIAVPAGLTLATPPRQPWRRGFEHLGER